MINLKYASIAGFLLAVAGLVTLLYKESLLAVGAIAITFQVLAVALMVWARITFGMRSFHAAANPTEGGLVTWGPYHFLRHPIYAAVIYFCWAGIASHFSVISVLCGIAIIGGLFIRMLAEERLVVTRYPEYSIYARKTKRIIPYIF